MSADQGFLNFMKCTNYEADPVPQKMENSCDSIARDVDQLQFEKLNLEGEDKFSSSFLDENDSQNGMSSSVSEGFSKTEDEMNIQSDKHPTIER
jgi:hypothetical protein